MLTFPRTRITTHFTPQLRRSVFPCVTNVLVFIIYKIDFTHITLQTSKPFQCLLAPLGKYTHKNIFVN